MEVLALTQGCLAVYRARPEVFMASCNSGTDVPSSR